MFVVTGVSILQGVQSLLAVRITSAVAILVDLILLGAMRIRARVVAWWCGVLLIVGFPLSLASYVALSLGGIVLGIVWGLIGYALLSLRGTVEEQPSRVS